MDFHMLLYLCPPDSHDSYPPATDRVKKKTLLYPL